MPPDIGAQYFPSMRLDKKAVAGELKLILPEKIGACEYIKGGAEGLYGNLISVKNAG